MPQVPSPPDREGFTAVHDLIGTGLDDDAITVRVTGVDHDTVVAFLSSGCLTCRRFWDAFAKPDDLGLPADMRVVVVTKDPAEESLSVIAGLAPPSVPLVMSSQAWADYDVPGSPYFVLVDGPTGAVRGEGTGPDWGQVQSLLGQATGDAAVVERLAASRVAKPNADAAPRAAHRRGTAGGRCATRRSESLRDGGRSRRRRWSVIGIIVALGLPVAVLGAIRSTWSP